MQPLLIPTYHEFAVAASNGSNEKKGMKINADLSSECFNLQLDTINHHFRDPAGSSSPTFHSQ
jgi:hypothetical protein